MSKSSVAYIVSVATLVVAVWLGVSIGSVKIPIRTLWNAGADETATTYFVEYPHAARLACRPWSVHRWRLRGLLFKDC